MRYEKMNDIFRENRQGENKGKGEKKEEKHFGRKT